MARMENNYKLDPLRDHLVLQEIFSNLSLYELKVVRQVCRIWGEEGALNLRHRPWALNIHVNPPQQTYIARATEINLRLKEWTDFDVLAQRIALRDFLVRYKLSHTLHLSLLPSFPWQLNTTEIENKYGKEIYRLIYQGYYLQENELNFASNILDNYLPKVAPFIKELRLELMLKQSEDFQMLENILEAVEQFVEKFCLEIVAFSDKLLQKIKPTKDHRRSKVKTLAIRLVPATNISLTATQEQSLPFPGIGPLMYLFPNISFLDIIGLRPINISHKPIKNKTIKLLKAATRFNLKLDGIRVEPRTVVDFQAIKEFARAKPLKFLYLNIGWTETKSASIFKALEEIMKKSADSLERFDLEWRPMEAETCPKLGFPPLKNLKSLTYASKYMGRSEPDIVEQDFEDERLTECFGFGELFADSGKLFNLKCPALESLSIILVGHGDGELWKEIFHPENNGNCISSKIQTLVVTFAGECESEEIQKFPRTLFPNLMQFRHGKLAEGGNKIFVCHHEYDPEGRLTRKWSWLAAVKKYRGIGSGATVEGDSRYDICEFGEYFYTIREKFRLRMGDHGFWDTELDIERTDFHFGRSEV